jgi:hypothetical protein
MKLSVYITGLILVLFVSCKKNSSETSVQWNMNRVVGDTTCKIDQTIFLTVYYPTTSSCDIFDRFESTTQDHYFSFKAFGHTETSKFCSQIAIEKSVEVKFTPVSAGSYELRFINKDNSYISHTITVN